MQIKTRQNAAVYVVIPDDAVRNTLLMWFETLGLRVSGFNDVESFLANEVDATNGCLLIEVTLPGLSGAELVVAIRTRGIELPVLMTGAVGYLECQTVIQKGVVELVENPMQYDGILKILDRLLPAEPGIRAALPTRHRLNDGAEVTIRGMRPSDAKIEQNFVRSLSPHSRFMRFFSGFRELPDYLLQRFTHPLYPLNWALIATIELDGEEKEVGVARYVSTSDPSEAEFAVTVTDEWQGRGLGHRLMRQLMSTARRAGIEKLEGVVLRENHGMLRLACNLGFAIESIPGDFSVVKVSASLVNAVEADCVSGLAEPMSTMST